MNVEDYLKKRNVQPISDNNYSPYLKSLIKRTLITGIIILLVLITVNVSNDAKSFLNKYLFQTNFSFSKFTSLYKKYIADIGNTNVKPVNSNNIISYTSLSDYLDGCEIIPENNTINLLESGIVVFIGEKEGYGNTVIVQQSNGIDAWYGNLENVSVTMYSYIEKNTIVGSAKDKLYMVFMKNGEYLDYKDYIK